MKRIVLALSFSLLVAPVLAQSPTDAPSVAPASEVVLAEGEAKEAPAAAQGKLAQSNERHCLRHTGTRISRRDRDGCVNAPGRAYDRDDIDSTGAVTVAEALEKLDPSVTVRR